ncbi:Pls/PosA family non-ribosomal peptide synthetase [Kocuria rosea]|uniref:Pls/PosA family non-ribosomal peptide synthetase n=1 Tax=Kocuria rosea TaxID=1275 RepID=UPI0021B4EDC7|nr:Pls/PosA family non-ribosomal peptide synthetase [Kocuria rosea]WJZ65459.1 phosphopantetheine-binding protein [Kocuria rosea]
MKKLADALPASPLPPISVPTRREPPSAPALEGTGADLPLERRLADLLASVVQQDDVPVDADFFADLGADSLVMARFCARVRKQPDLPAVSMKDVYQHPTITSLAGALAPAQPVPVSVSVQDRLAEVLTGVLGGEQVPVDSHFFADLGADSLVMARFCARVRKQPDLPAVSMKDIYQHPTITALAGALAPPQPVPVSVQDRLAEVLTGVLGGEQVPVDSHFFDDLGADSLVMAQFCARVRKHPDLPALSIKDVYQHPTVRSLAASLGVAAPVTSNSAAMADTSTARATGLEASSVLTPAAPPARGSRVGSHRPPSAPGTPATQVEYVLCGVLQVLIFLAYTSVFAVIFERGLQWVWTGEGLFEHYLRGAEFGAVIFVVMCTFPILAKWVLIGRWRPQEIRIWSLAYVRFWFVKTVVVANPLVLFAGSPLYLLYLRALGAKVGKGAVVFTRHMPVCTDMITIGEHTVIDKDTFFSGYRAINGVIQTGPVSIGKDVFVGEKAVLDIGTSLGDGAQLGHASSLHAGQSVPEGEHWHGSPGQRTESDYRAVDPTDCGAWRRVWYSIFQVLLLVGVTLPVAVAGLGIILTDVPWLAVLLHSPEVSFTSASFYDFVLVTSVVLFFGGILLAVLLVMTIPRLLNLAITPERAYPLYGFHFACHRAIEGMTNRRFLHDLFGDSSYIVHYLQGLGYKLAPVVQTGSNFGTEIKHDNPYLTSVGTGTVVASGISIVNANYSSTSFSVSRSSIAANSFFGNEILYPPQAKTGQDCLIATKALVPIDGPVLEGVGLLGSPAFEIPRTVQRDSEFIRMAHDEELPRRLAAKNRHNLVTIGLFLLARWFYAFVFTLLGFIAVDLHQVFGAASILLVTIPPLLFGVFYGALVERASTGFKPLKPKHCSIYDIDFWRTERFFKLEAEVSPIFNGTPFKGVILRMLGVRVGKRLFDDGAQIAEKNLVTLGDDVALNARAWVQCHSQEDYAFKSDAITIGSGCTVGVSAMILYSATMGDGAVLAPDSFLMKGEEIPAHEMWGGNPAEALTDPTTGRQPRELVAASPAVAPALRDGATDAVATR